MATETRFIPDGGSVVEVTDRTIHGCFRLRPCRVLNEVVVGALARAREFHPVDVIAVVALSNHYHLLLWTPDAKTLADFMAYFKQKLGKEVNRLQHRKGPVWDGRYTAIPVSDEPEAQIARLDYILAHGAKEDLVPRPEHWPGVHCARELTAGEPLRGVWFDRTAEGKARRRGERVTRYTHSQSYELELAKLPCWSDLDDETYRQRIAERLKEVQDRVEARRRAEEVRLSSAAVCAKRIRRQDPFDRPEELKPRRRRPLIHAASRRVREEFQQAYRLFLAAYRLASELYRAGDRDVRFPPGSFPPALPFVKPASALPT